MGEIWGYETDRLFQESDFDGNNGEGNPIWYYGSNTPNQDALNTANSFHYGPGDVKYKDLNGLMARWIMGKELILIMVI